MKTLVTGGLGFIGSHTVVELLAEGHQVEILDNLSNAKESVLPRLEEITGVRPPFHRIDIRDEAGLESVFAAGGFEVILHFAGLKAVGESVEKPLEYYSANVAGSTTLLTAARRHGVKTFVFSSSCTVYGDPDRVPVTETDPTKDPTNPYGWSKLMIERILKDVHHSEPGWNIALLRYFNPVGAHESGVIGEDPNDVPNNLMPYITQVAAERLPELRVFGGDYPTPDGTGIRDYIHVVDLARGHVAAMRYMAERPGLHIWNLGTGRGSSVLEMVAAFEQATGVSVPYRIVERRPGDLAETWADPSKAQRELGWSADPSLERMCADAWRWQQYAARID